ncbi:MAG: hypothetical protein ACHRXM_24150, partial [Isosphaerales bacterium]
SFKKSGVAAPLPCMTIRILGLSWPYQVVGAVPKARRGEVVLFQGSGNDRLILQSLELGLIEVLSDNARYTGDLALLPACPPAGRGQTPKGRSTLKNYPLAGTHGSPAAAQFLRQ